jgi:AcrR family transcriptional regulator
VANDIRQRMIEQAVKLLAMKGLQGASFSEVLQASGAPRGSLYHHFPGGKDELVLAALDVAGGRALSFLDTLEGRPAGEVARAFFGLWRIVLERSDFGAGCAVVAVTVAADSSELLDAAAGVFRAWRERLGACLAAGGIAPARAPTIAALLISASEGAVAVARAERSFTPFDLVAAELQQMVEAAVS